MSAETVASLLAWARGQLGPAGFTTAALDARLLLQHGTGLDHNAIIGRPETIVPEADALKYRSMVARRLRHEPVSRIIGMREFYGRNFRLSAETLDPRPDTETLIAVAVERMKDKPTPRILDLGTGCGAIAVTLLAELPEARAMATDISPGALEAASCNAREYGVAARLELVRTSWLDGLAGCFDLIISNPPYLSAGEIEGLTPEVKDWDPRRALDGGSDGLDCYRAIASGARDHLMPDGAVILEIGSGQQGQVTEILAESGFEREAAYRDLAGHVRCLVFGIRKMGVGNASNLSYIPTR